MSFYRPDTTWSEEAFLEFLHEAHCHTYAATREVAKNYKAENFLPEHIDYEYQKGDWLYRDSYAGYYWPPGKEVIFFQNKPIWCMSYQGMLTEKHTHDSALEIYLFLKNALRKTPADMPFRGPNFFQENNMRYEFHIQGDSYYFTGREEIFQNEKLVFFQDIMASAIF